jgi:hypothetical protein
VERVSYVRARGFIAVYFLLQMLAGVFERCMKRRGVKETDPYDWEKLATENNATSPHVTSNPPIASATKPSGGLTTENVDENIMASLDNNQENIEPNDNKNVIEVCMYQTTFSFERGKLFTNCFFFLQFTQNARLAEEARRRRRREPYMLDSVGGSGGVQSGTLPVASVTNNQSDSAKEKICHNNNILESPKRKKKEDPSKTPDELKKEEAEKDEKVSIKI